MNEQLPLLWFKLLLLHLIATCLSIDFLGYVCIKDMNVLLHFLDHNKEGKRLSILSCSFRGHPENTLLINGDKRNGSSKDGDRLMGIGLSMYLDWI